MCRSQRGNPEVNQWSSWMYFGMDDIYVFIVDLVGGRALFMCRDWTINCVKAQWMYYGHHRLLRKAKWALVMMTSLALCVSAWVLITCKDVMFIWRYIIQYSVGISD